MASINDVYNQLVTVNSALASINTNVIAGTSATNAVKTSVDKLDTDVKSGFAATVAALDQAVAVLSVIAAIEVEEVKLMFHLTEQADTMICALEHISQNTCGILTQATVQTGLQTGMRNDLDALLAIAETTNPAAALESERLAALRAEIHRCCPPETTPPACSYAPCPRPKPVGQPKLPDLPKPKGDTRPK
ncbi:MAG: hypothetical protein V4610_16980 [Pseudomonadota bacterium]|jgi:hypothetical protein|uniref:Uncharacterized protein n=1 Tax=hydrothermal vent metagenome TaxID=652676 RepID=A0A161K0B4_9ZZZZ